MIPQEKTFYIQNNVIPWFQIKNWWEDLREVNPKAAIMIGDPYYSELACMRIALNIINDINHKLGKPLVKLEEIYEQKKSNIKQNNQYIKPNNEVTLSSWEFDWTDNDLVIKKAFEQLEAKKKQEAERQQENANFWRQKQEEKKQVDIDRPFRTVLGIVDGETLTIDIVKKQFRIKAMICHPDKGGTMEQLEELIEARNKAYLFLGVKE